MSAPVSGMEAAEQPAAETLLDAFKTIEPAERKKHEAVLNYWLSIRGERELPPLRDLDPLEISDAAPSSVLLELVGGGEDGEIRHLGERLRAGGEADRVSEAPRPSILASIARKLSIVAVSRNFLAFEDEFPVKGEATRCWVTMLPLSSAGAWVDYIYAFVSFGPAVEAETAPVEVETEAEAQAPEVAEIVEAEAEQPEVAEAVELEPEAEITEPAEIEAEAVECAPVEEEPESAEAEDVPDPVDVLELDSPVEEPVDAVDRPEEAAPEPGQAAPGKKEAGFSFDPSASGFYAKAVKVNPTLPKAAPATAKAPSSAERDPAPAAEQETMAPAKAEAAPAPQEKSKPAAEEKPHKTTSATEASLQSKLTDVRAKADEARMAKLRANMALYEGLSAAYDFALDAEDSPEEYLKIVEGAGLKIQLRAPMRPVVKLAFDGMCDDSTIAQLEAVLAWAIEQELPRGTLAKHIEEAGGIGPILNGLAKAA
ncbi:MAG: hypothetical protein ACTHOI_00315 [Sphingomicrobium sp.]